MPLTRVRKKELIPMRRSILTVLIIALMPFAAYHRRPTHTGGGRFEFHGNFELRALPAGDVSPSAAMPAAEMMSRAPLVLSAQGVDVVIEKAPEQ